MKLPITIKIVPSKEYTKTVQRHWEFSERLFKFVGWCLITSLVLFGYRKTGDWRLAVLSALLGGQLLLLLIATMRFGFVYKLDIPHVPRVASGIIEKLLGYAAAAAVGIGGYDIFKAILHALDELHALH